MLVRPFFALSLFLFATAVTPSAFAQTLPPTAPSPELSTPAPALDATIIVEVDSGDANVHLDGQPIAGALSGNRSPVMAGHHVVEAFAAGRPPIRREIDVPAGATVGVVLHVVPLSVDAIGYDAPKEDGPPRPDRGPPRLPLILIGAGVSIVALGLALGFNLAASAQSNDAEAQQVVIGQAEGTTSTCNTPTRRFAPACTALHDDLVARDQNADVAVAAYATAAGAAAATIAYAVWSIPTEGHQRWTSSLRPAPIFGTSTGGFAVAGVF
jgi:hypothetical protein